jgi:hypothetical protein
MTAHPCHARLPEGAEKEARAQLTFFAAGYLLHVSQDCLADWMRFTDRMLNPEDSVVPFSKDTSKELLEVLKGIGEDPNCFKDAEGSGRSVRTWVISRVMERIGLSSLPL